MKYEDVFSRYDDASAMLAMRPWNAIPGQRDLLCIDLQNSRNNEKENSDGASIRKKAPTKRLRR
jgi:hypothetical protein